MTAVIITCNAGSSNTKLAVFDTITLEKKGHTTTHNDAETYAWLCSAGSGCVAAIGHRVVHGGTVFSEAAEITPEVLKQINKLSSLAPLHQPASLKLIEEAGKLYPKATQIACFDTAFHHTKPEIEKMLPLPRHFEHEGMIRYGFHGLSYQYIASILPDYLGEKANGKVVVAHLGNGSSMCAMKERKSIASTMGFSTLDGLMMGSRTGSIDAGVVLHLLQQQKMKAEEVENILYHQSGLKGVSGISADMRDLENSSSSSAKEAIELYCYLAAKQLGGLITILGGMDALVFTGGIGEHSGKVRSKISGYLEWMGIRINETQNRQNSATISDAASSTPVLVIPTDEEVVIAQSCHTCLSFST